MAFSFGQNVSVCKQKTEVNGFFLAFRSAKNW